MAEIRLRVLVEELDTDPAALDDAVRSLVQEVEHVPSARVEPDPGGPAPEGSRGLEAASVQAILVSIPAMVVSVQSLLSVLRAWQRRRRGLATSAGALKIQFGEKSLELAAADEETTARLVEAWLASTTGPERIE
ncbi:hypothetical protein [Flindersiella endophytica]